MEANGNHNTHGNGTDTTTMDSERAALRAALNFPSRDVSTDDSFGGVAPRISPPRFWPAPTAAVPPPPGSDVARLQATVDQLTAEVHELGAKLDAILQGLFGSDDLGRDHAR